MWIHLFLHLLHVTCSHLVLPSCLGLGTPPLHLCIHISKSISLISSTMVYSFISSAIVHRIAFTYLSRSLSYLPYLVMLMLYQYYLHSCMILQASAELYNYFSHAFKLIAKLLTFHNTACSLSCHQLMKPLCCPCRLIPTQHLPPVVTLLCTFWHALLAQTVVQMVMNWCQTPFGWTGECHV